MPQNVATIYTEANPPRCGECSQYTEPATMEDDDGRRRHVWWCHQCKAFGGRDEHTDAATSRPFGPANRALRAQAAQAVHAWMEVAAEKNGWSKWRAVIEADRHVKANGLGGTHHTAWRSPGGLRNILALFGGGR